MMSDQSICSRQSQARTFSTEEESYLKFLAENFPGFTWNQIALEMGKKFSHKQRTGKQYRERYVNYLKMGNFCSARNIWSEEEQSILFKKYRQMGTKWTQIGKLINNKPQNSIKNKFYGSLRKVLRLINRIGRQHVKKFNKAIEYYSLIRIMDAAEGGQDLPIQIQSLSKEVKSQILDMVENFQQAHEVASIVGVIKKIHHFNIATRCYNSKKWRKSNGFPGRRGKDQSQESNQSDKNVSEKETAKLEQDDILGIQNQQQHPGRNSEQNKLETIYPQLGTSLLDSRSPTSSDNGEEFKIKDQVNLPQLLMPCPKDNLKNDLELQLCSILHYSYVPQIFDDFLY